MTRVVAICADDYGHAPAIDRGILKLAAQGRITDISCIVNGPGWPAAARRLKTLPALMKGRVRAGLHFNLTEGRPLAQALAASWPKLPHLQQLIVQAHLGRLPAAALREELQAQLWAFEHALGQRPKHIDGHQHVHHLPQVRDALLAQLPKMAAVKVRHTGRVQGPGYTVKRLLIEGTGGRALGRRLDALRCQSNTHLFGVYDFVAADYRGLMQRWLARLPEAGGLIFCHPGEAPEAPGEATQSPGDPIAAARVRELAYLGSDEFRDDLAAADVRLA